MAPHTRNLNPPTFSPPPPQVTNTSLHDPAPWANGASFGSVLLEPTIIYVKRVLELHDKVGCRLGAGWGRVGVE